jgi:hypothetical protein
MTYIPDLSNYCYLATGASLRSVGWLERGKPFEAGVAAPDFVVALRQQLEDPFGVIDFVGSHACSLCEQSGAPHGNGELIVPTSTVCYVAPVLIGHYVEAHGYLPPPEFIDALRRCPPQKSPAYMKLVQPFLQELCGAA